MIGGAAGSEATMPQPNLDDIRQAMRMAVAPCSDEHRARASPGQIARAASAVELWLLRSSLYQSLARTWGRPRHSGARQICCRFLAARVTA